MSSCKITTKLFGELKITEADGICEFFDIILDGRSMSVVLNIFDGFLNDENIESVHRFVEEIPNLYAKGMQKLQKVKDSDAAVKFFMEWHLDELQNEMLELFRLASLDRISSEMFINLLSLRTISIAPNADNEIDCTLDFSLPEDCSDELLAVRFDKLFEIYDISHES